MSKEEMIKHAGEDIFKIVGQKFMFIRKRKFQ
jgi:hypothetical protein